jgi:hypothetical protein
VIQLDICEDCKNFHNCSLRRQNEESGIIPAFCSEHRSILEFSYRKLQDVYDVFIKWFPNIDTTRIDTRLAWYISNDFGLGNPIWIFELARSGNIKTTLTNAFIGIPKNLEIDQLTAKSLASGLEVGKGKNKRPAFDIGKQLENRNRCIIVNETAYIKAMQQGDQRETFAVLKSLHDGRIKRDTGSNVSKDYKNCNTSIWFNSTPDFRIETIIHQEIGTCYLVDAIPLDMSNDEEDSRIAIKNRNKQEEIKRETQHIVSCYLAHHYLNKDYQLTEDEQDFIIKESNRLKFLRTTGTYDNKDELTYLPEPEKPSRLSIQLSKLYQSLMSLDEDYDKNRAKKIIQRIVDGSGDPILIKILDFIDGFCWYKLRAEDEIVKFTVVDVLSSTGLGTGTIKRRLELLCGLGFLIKEPKEPGSKGGRWGYQYKLDRNIEEDKWQLLFRYNTLKDKDFKQNPKVIL